MLFYVLLFIYHVFSLFSSNRLLVLHLIEAFLYFTCSCFLLVTTPVPIGAQQLLQGHFFCLFKDYSSHFISIACLTSSASRLVKNKMLTNT